MVRPLLGLNHGGKTIFRMSVNPAEIIRKIELGTSPLDARIKALNETARDGYPVGLLIAPVILLSDWERMYKELIEKLADELTEKVKQTALIEIILMTYSYVHNAINADAFPNAVKIYDNKLMTGKGRGKYSYRSSERQKAEDFFRKEISRKLPEMKILYIS
ncbi:MAG: spore photoproduct lyase family protein [Acutalibacteraceae bacterium]